MKSKRNSSTHPLEALVKNAFEFRDGHDGSSLAPFLGSDYTASQKRTFKYYRAVAEDVLEYMEKQGKLRRDRYGWWRLVNAGTEVTPEEEAMHDAGVINYRWDPDCDLNGLGPLVRDPSNPPPRSRARHRRLIDMLLDAGDTVKVRQIMAAYPYLCVEYADRVAKVERRQSVEVED